MSGEPSIGFTLSWIARMLRTRFDARARALELTRAQWMMMLAIRVHEGATQSEVASRLEINSVTAGRIIDRLEAAGWATRQPDRVDRRVNRLSLTPAAEPMLDRLSAMGEREEATMLEGFCDEDRAALSRLLGRIVANMTAAPVPSAADATFDA